MSHRRQATSMLTVLALLIVAATSCGLFSDDVDDKDLMVIGDSLVYESSDELKQRLEEERLRLSAEPGETLAEQSDAIQAAVERDPDIVVVLLGTNDVLQGSENPDARVRAAMDALSPIACVRWLTIAPFYGSAEEVRLLNAAITNTADEYENTRVVEWGATVEEHPNWFDDLVHYTEEGQAALAETIVDAASSCAEGD